MFSNGSPTSIAELIDAGVLEIGDGYRAKNIELAREGVPFARAQNVNGGFHFRGADCFPVKHLARVGGKVSSPGDVVFTSKGTVGRFAFVGKDTPRFVYSPQLCYWRSRDTRCIDSRWLFYWMQSREFYVQYRGVAGQTDMADYVSLRDQRRMHMTIPPLAHQLAIAHILGTLDDKIETNRRMNETLEAMARALFKSWFVDFDPVGAEAANRNPGLPDQTAQLFPGSFEDSEMGRIPAGWNIGVLGDVAENVRRGVHPSDVDSTTPYIGLEHMPRGSIALSEWGIADGLDSGKLRFLRGEILFGKLRPYFHKVGVAAVDGVCSTDIVVVSPRDRMWFGFVLGHISSKEFVDHTDAGSTGTKMPRTSWGEMARYSVVLPPPQVASGFNRLVAPMIERIKHAIHESRTLAEIRDALLPKLVSGRIRVKDPDQFLEERGL